MSIVAMKRKMEAKRGLSVGGGFSINPKIKGTNVSSTTVKSARYANRSQYKRSVCFNGAEGIICERVWDGKRDPASIMGSAESITQEEYITNKKTIAASCRNVLIDATNATAGTTTVIVRLESNNYVVVHNGRTERVEWNHSNSVVAGVVNALTNNTMYVKSFSNSGARTVELASELNGATTLTFKNPEVYIFEPVGCSTLSDGSGLGGTSGSDNRGYYGRGRCKVHYVSKSPQFQIKTYTGTGGYLDKIKRPNTDASFCG